MVLDPHWRLDIPKTDLDLLLVYFVAVDLELLHKKSGTSLSCPISIRVALSFSYSGVSLRLRVVERKVEIM